MLSAALGVKVHADIPFVCMILLHATEACMHSGTDAFSHYAK